MSEPLSQFKEIHPIRHATFTGEDLPSDTRVGASGAKVNESRFVRCKFCTSINDTERRPKGDGWGGNISYPTMTGGGVQKNPTIGGAGCWFCGSSNYY